MVDSPQGVDESFVTGTPAPRASAWKSTAYWPRASNIRYLTQGSVESEWHGLGLERALHRLGGDETQVCM